MGKRLFMVAAILCVAVLVLTGLSAFLGSAVLTSDTYSVPCGVSEKVRIVHLTDLHSQEFGVGNERLVELVQAQTPDLIFMTGDMLDSEDAGPEVVLALIRELVKVAPVYYSMGNHERAWESRTGIDLAPLLTQVGATVLDGSYTDVTVKGQELRIGGYYGYYRVPHMIHDDPLAEAAENAFFDDFENTGRVKLLLCHIPTAWVDWNYIDKYPAGVVFSGHYHGGMVRLPFVGGLVAPYVGWFPEYTEGMFQGEKATCLLSTGLGTSMNLPRINNLPQVLVVELTGE